MEYTNYKTYWYKYSKGGKNYKVRNLYVESTTYNATMVKLKFEDDLKMNK